MGHTTPELRRVGIVGGGAGGISRKHLVSDLWLFDLRAHIVACNSLDGAVAAKSLREFGHDVVVFEQSASIGGVWKYHENGDAPSAVVYKSLRTNLPTTVMQLPDLSFPDDAPSFPSHADVQRYLEEYASRFNVTPLVQLNSTVTRAEKIDGHWRLHVTSADRGEYEEEFDRLLIASGHGSKPQFVTVNGIEHFRGRVTHSRSYRTPDAYVNKRVLLIGRGPSGQDISLELAASGAKEVVVAVLDYDPNQTLPKHDQRIIKPAIDHITDSGNVVFEDGSSILAPDEIIYCTGYLYAGRDLLPDELLFPKAAIYAQTGELSDETIEGLRDVADNDLAVAPLYKHVFAIEDPTVGFIALATGSLPFLCSEIQARWAARVFAGVSPLPPRHEMYSELFELVKKLDGKFKNLHKTEQRQCFIEVAALADSAVDTSIYEMYEDAGFLRSTYPYNYRSAEYRRDADSGKWVRRLTLDSESSELIRVFELNKIAI